MTYLMKSARMASSKAALSISAGRGRAKLFNANPLITATNAEAA
jgi:hypothetical protein